MDESQLEAMALDAEALDPANTAGLTQEQCERIRAFTFRTIRALLGVAEQLNCCGLEPESTPPELE